MTILVPLLFLITCTPYDYLINLHAARERNSTHNHNGHDVLTQKFVFISLFAFIASIVLIRFNRLNLSMVYNRRAFKYQNCAVIVVEERRYPKLNEVNVGKIQDWFQGLDKYMSLFGKVLALDTIFFAVSFICLISSLMIDRFLGPIDTCLAFTAVLTYVPSVFFFTELNRTNREVSEIFSFKYIGDSNIYALSLAEVKVLFTVILFVVAAILNIQIPNIP